MRFPKRHFADTFTLLRIILGLTLFLSGFIDRQAELARDIWLLVLAWSTDMVDGRISRSLKTAGTTWLGKQDVYVDMFVSIMVLLYMAVTGLLGIVFILAYLLIWGVVFLRWGLRPQLAQVFQNPIYAIFVYFTLQSAPSVLPLLAIWASISLILFWRRVIELLKDLINSVIK